MGMEKFGLTVHCIAAGIEQPLRNDIELSR